MLTEIVGIWDGDYRSTVAMLCCKCKDIRVMCCGSKLIIKDTSLDFYSCIPRGDFIRIPVYPPCDDDDDPPIILEEPKQPTPEERRSLSSEQEERHRRWGLIP